MRGDEDALSVASLATETVRKRMNLLKTTVRVQIAMRRAHKDSATRARKQSPIFQEVVSQFWAALQNEASTNSGSLEPANQLESIRRDEYCKLHLRISKGEHSCPRFSQYLIGDPLPQCTRDCCVTCARVRYRSFMDRR